MPRKFVNMGKARYNLDPLRLSTHNSSRLNRYLHTKMIIIIFSVIFVAILADGNLTAVHYSIVSPGSDSVKTACKYLKMKFEIIRGLHSADFYWNCDGCSVTGNGGYIQINNDFIEPTLYNASIKIDLIENQHVR